MRKDWKACCAAIDECANRGADGVDPLIAALQDPQTCEPDRVVVALAGIGDERALEPLIQAMDEARFNRYRMPYAFAKFGQSAVPLLMHKLQGSSDAIVREAAAESLGTLKAAVAFDSLVIALEDPQHRVVSKAAIALLRLQDTRAVPFLLAALRAAPPDQRYWLKVALTGLGSRPEEP